jgi:hypothetical protein
MVDSQVLFSMVNECSRSPKGCRSSTNSRIPGTLESQAYVSRLWDDGSTIASFR